MAEMVVKNYQRCGKEFRSSGSHKRKNCSRACRAAVILHFTCTYCGKEINRTAKTTGTGKRPFGSRDCYHSFTRGENHADWRGSKYVPTRGYVMVYTRVRKKRRKEHIVLAEKALGRPLKKDECIHHVEGDKTNNKPGNLIICTNSYHKMLHSRMSYLYKVEHFQKGGG